MLGNWKKKFYLQDTKVILYRVHRHQLDQLFLGSIDSLQNI